MGCIFFAFLLLFDLLPKTINFNPFFAVFATTTSVMLISLILGSARARSLLGPLELPVTNNFSQYMELVNKLPDDDKPSMFGLPENIMQSYQRTQSTLTINQLRTLMRSL